MISMPAPVRVIVHDDQLIRDVMIMISPIRLGRGGSARLAKLEMNHQAVMRGRMAWRPRASTIVRLCVRS